MNILAIDLGSYCIKAAIVKANAGRLDLLSQSSVNTAGIRQGTVTSIDKASSSIIDVIEKVRENISIHIDKTVVSVNAAYLKTYNSRARLVLENGATITLANIKQTLENAYNQTGLANDEVALHVLPWRFYAGNGTVVEDPLGMCSSSIALEAHVIAINQNDLNNLKKILEIAGVGNYELVAGIYADSIYALRDDEKERCTAVVDIGHDICQLAIYKQNSIAWLDFLRFGSSLISEDLVNITKMQEEVARRLKVDHVYFQDGDNIEVEHKDGNSETLNMEIIRRVIESRMVEMLEVSRGVLRRSEFGQEYTSVVFMGGMFNAKDIKERAKPKFDNMSVRVHAEPHPCFNPSDCQAFYLPEYSCMFGLCMYGAGYHTNYELNVDGCLKAFRQNGVLEMSEMMQQDAMVAPELNLANSLHMEQDVEQVYDESLLVLQEAEEGVREDGLLVKIKDKCLKKLVNLF